MIVPGALVFAAAALQSPSNPGRRPRPAIAHRARTAPGALDLYSARERRRLANLLQLQLLELRKADLERVYRALQRQLEGAGDLCPPTLRR